MGRGSSPSASRGTGSRGTATRDEAPPSLRCPIHLPKAKKGRQTLATRLPGPWIKGHGWESALATPDPDAHPRARALCPPCRPRTQRHGTVRSRICPGSRGQQSSAGQSNVEPSSQRSGRPRTPRRLPPPLPPHQNKTGAGHPRRSQQRPPRAWPRAPLYQSSRWDPECFKKGKVKATDKSPAARVPRLPAGSSPSALAPPSQPHILPPNLQREKNNNHNKTSSHQQGGGGGEEGRRLSRQHGSASAACDRPAGIRARAGRRGRWLPGPAPQCTVTRSAPHSPGPGNRARGHSESPTRRAPPSRAQLPAGPDGEGAPARAPAPPAPGDGAPDTGPRASESARPRSGRNSNFPN